MRTSKISKSLNALKVLGGGWMKSNINVCPRPFIILLLLSSLMYVWVLKPHNLGKNKEIFYIYTIFFSNCRFLTELCSHWSWGCSTLQMTLSILTECTTWSRLLFIVALALTGDIISIRSNWGQFVLMLVTTLQRTLYLHR